MGTYEISNKNANGAPLYMKRVTEGVYHFLFKSSGTGKWIATDDESWIAKNRCADEGRDHLVL